MTTIILTYRNRKINIIEKCLNSLDLQSVKDFKVILVNYGSLLEYSNSLLECVNKYKFIKLINCDVQEQLWNKCRAINIALRQCETPYVFVGDVDMVYHPNFIKTLNNLKSDTISTFFQVGFLSESESKLEKNFNDYNISFKSDEGATGMTFFKTDVLKSINGFDEFYHGWGSEDTDVHLRLRNAGFKVEYYDKEVLMLHQWHAKLYRTKDSLEPFHSYLEQINHEYLELSKKLKKTKANLDLDYGVYNQTDYDNLNKIEDSYTISNKAAEIKAFLYNILYTYKDRVINVKIKPHKEYRSVKQFVKEKIGKKTIRFIDLDEVNNILLETIIIKFRNSPYKYQYNPNDKTINLTIKL